MISLINRSNPHWGIRLFSQIQVFILSFSLALAPSASYAQSIKFLNLPVPGTLVPPSPAFVPVLLKGMTIHPENPLQFDFIIDSGNTDFTQEEIKKESERLIKYFLASMTVPKNDLWVNLSPYEDDRIIPDELGKTELGRDLLAQDYILKQLTASLMYPEEELGKKFWDKIYAQAQERFGASEIPMNTFNKVWILPESATIYEKDHTVYIVQSRLKVMLDEDYLALQNNKENKEIGADKISETEFKDTSSLSSQIVREIILPEIEKEVNQGKNFAQLRQIYYSLILAKWYKETIKTSLLSKVYVDQNKVAGVEIDDQTIKDQIYRRYMEAYQKGVFDFIKEDYDQLSREIIPRKYFSGGIKDEDIDFGRTNDRASLASSVVGDNYILAMRIAPQKEGGDASPEAKGESSFATADQAMMGESDRLKELNKELQEKIARQKKFLTDLGKQGPEVFLDSKGVRKEIDKRGMMKRLKARPQRLLETIDVAIKEMGEIIDQRFSQEDRYKIKKVKIVGLGGSFIAGELALDVIRTEGGLGYEAEVIRDIRNIKGKIGEDTLVILVSFSGNTNEIIEAARELTELQKISLDNQPKIVTLTGAKGSGGILGKEAEDQQWTHIKMPDTEGFVRGREATITQMISLLAILSELNLPGGFNIEKLKLKESLEFIRKQTNALYDFDVPYEKNNAKKTAARLLYDYKAGRNRPFDPSADKKTPYIITAEQLKSIGSKFQRELAGHAEIVALFHEVPEFYHDTIEATKTAWESGSKYSMLFLRSKDEEPKEVSERLDRVIEEIFPDENRRYQRAAVGNTAFERMLDLLFFTEWVGNYMSLLNGIDPAPQVVTEYLVRKPIGKSREAVSEEISKEDSEAQDTESFGVTIPEIPVSASAVFSRPVGLILPPQTDIEVLEAHLYEMRADKHINQSLEKLDARGVKIKFGRHISDFSVRIGNELYLDETMLEQEYKDMWKSPNRMGEFGGTQLQPSLLLRAIFSYHSSRDSYIHAFIQEELIEEAVAFLSELEVLIPFYQGMKKFSPKGIMAPSLSKHVEESALMYSKLLPKLILAWRLANKPHLYDRKTGYSIAGIKEIISYVLTTSEGYGKSWPELKLILGKLREQGDEKQGVTMSGVDFTKSTVKDLMFDIFTISNNGYLKLIPKFGKLSEKVLGKKTLDVIAEQILRERMTRMLRKNLEEFRRYHVEELKTKEKAWDYIFIAAASKAQADGFRKELEYHRNILDSFHPHTNVEVVYPPNDQNIDNGGATFYAVRKAAEAIANEEGKQYESIQKIFKGKRVLVILSGGDSKRIPIFSAIGKAFTTVPTELITGTTGGPQGQKPTSTLFDEIYTMLSGAAGQMKEGMVVIPGDAQVIFDYNDVNLEGKPGELDGLIEVVWRAPWQEAINHGVRATEKDLGISDKNILATSIEAKSKADMEKLIGKDGSVNLSTALIKADVDSMARMAELGGFKLVGGRPQEDLTLAGSVMEKVKLGLYEHILPVFAKKMTAIDYIMGRSAKIAVGDISGWDALLSVIKGEMEDPGSQILKSKLEEHVSNVSLDSIRKIPDVKKLTDEMKEAIVKGLNAITDNLTFFKDNAMLIDDTSVAKDAFNELVEAGLLDQSGALTKKEEDLTDKEKEKIKWFNAVILKYLYPQIFSMQHARQRIWDTFRKADKPVEYHIQSTTPFIFADFGTTLQFYEHLMTRDDVNRVYRFRSWMNHFVDMGVDVTEESKIYDSILLGREGRVQAGAIVIYSNLDKDFKIGRRTIVYGVNDSQGKLKLKDNNVIYQLPIKIDGKEIAVSVLFGMDDDPKKFILYGEYVEYVKVDGKVKEIKKKGNRNRHGSLKTKTTLFGRDFLGWLEERGIAPDEVWDKKVKDEDRDLWNAKLYVPGDDDFHLTLWMQEGGIPDKKILEDWKNSKRVSMGDIVLLSNHDRLFAQRDEIRKDPRILRDRRTFSKFDKKIRSIWDYVLENSLKEKDIEKRFIRYDPGRDEQGVLKIGRRGNLIVRYDPRRGKEAPDPQVDADVLPAKPQDKSEFEDLPKKKDLFKDLLKIKGNRYRVIANHKPIFRNHVLLISEEVRPQVLTEYDIENALALMRDNHIRLYFNSLGAAASVSHFHLQGFYGYSDEYQPVETDKLPVQDAPIEPLFKIGDVKVGRVAEYPATALVFEADEEKDLSRAFYDFVRFLQRKDVNVNVPHNVLFTRNKIYIFLKDKENGKTITTDIDINPAAPELSGIITVKTSRFKDNLPTLEELEKALKKATVSEKELEEILRGYLSVLQGKDPNFFLTNKEIAKLIWIFTSSKEEGRKAKERLRILNSQSSLSNEELEEKQSLAARIAELNKIRLEVIKRITTFSAPQTIQVLTAALQDELYEVYLEAARGLGKIKDKKAVEALINVLKSKEKGKLSLKREAIISLGKIGDSKAIKALEDVLKDSHLDEILRKAAAWALGEIGGKKAFDILLKRLRSEKNPEKSAIVRREISLAMVKTGIEIPAVVNGVYAIFKKEQDWQVRKALVRVLYNLGGEQARKILNTIQNDPAEDLGVRTEALLVLTSGQVSELHRVVQESWKGNIINQLTEAKSNSLKIEISISDEVRETIEKRDKASLASIIEDLWERRGYWEKLEQNSERMGWLRSAYDMEEKVAEFKTFGEQSRKDFDNVVIMGMGGATQGIYTYLNRFGFSRDASGFWRKEGFPSFYILDTSSPKARKVLDANLDLNKTLFIYSSKAGGAPEPKGNFEYYYEKTFDDKAKHFVVITDPDFPLDHEAKTKGLKVFYSQVNVGGRFTALNTEMLIPAAIMGVDISELLRRVKEYLIPQLRSYVELKDNPAARLAVVFDELRKQGRDKVTLVSSGNLQEFAPWLEQLFAESLGKDKEGIIPISQEDLSEQDVYGDDRVFIYVKNKNERNEDIEKKLSSLRKRHPVIEIAIPEKSEAIGELFFVFEMTIALLGQLMEINPFNELGVIISKQKANQILQKGLPTRDSQYQIQNKGITLDYEAMMKGEKAISVEELEATLKRLNQTKGNMAAVYAALMYLAKKREKKYAALLPYMVSSSEERAIWQNWRARLREITQMATFMGEGPRYQHSALQLFQDGPNTGFFTLLGEDDDSAENKLIKAQRGGTLEALQAAGRMVVNISVNELNDGTRTEITNLFENSFNFLQQLDKAMLVEDVGGIDLKEIPVERQGSGVNIQFDPAAIQPILDSGVDGFAPVIINLTPINSIMPILGLEPRKEEELEVSNLNS